ncbi:hypothetical protein Cni_G08151 [Canna indica]|uniref:Uncharacterized protein n=1 Tax=Canna indica TaxID=4628 RepID=A0AAQ3JZS9_9LILI|nr:hypothetical protein Cni_G08151 [Canna indica]
MRVAQYQPQNLWLIVGPMQNFTLQMWILGVRGAKPLVESGPPTELHASDVDLGREGVESGPPAELHAPDMDPGRERAHYGEEQVPDDSPVGDLIGMADDDDVASVRSDNHGMHRRVDQQLHALPELSHGEHQRRRIADRRLLQRVGFSDRQQQRLCLLDYNRERTSAPLPSPGTPVAFAPSLPPLPPFVASPPPPPSTLQASPPATTPTGTPADRGINQGQRPLLLPNSALKLDHAWLMAVSTVLVLGVLLFK